MSAHPSVSTLFFFSFELVELNSKECWYFAAPDFILNLLRPVISTTRSIVQLLANSIPAFSILFCLLSFFCKLARKKACTSSSRYRPPFITFFAFWCIKQIMWGVFVHLEEESINAAVCSGFVRCAKSSAVIRTVSNVIWQVRRINDSCYCSLKIRIHI